MALTDDVKEIKDGVPQTGIVELSIENIEKTPVRINGRDDSIIYLNLFDMGILERLDKGYADLQSTIREVSEFDVDSDDLSQKLRSANTRMCEAIDYIFDSPISEVLSRGGTMYDVKNGEYRFETILSSLFGLYEQNINTESKRMRKRIKEQVEKYVPQDHKPKSRSKKKEIVQNNE